MQAQLLHLHKLNPFTQAVSDQTWPLPISRTNHFIYLAAPYSRRETEAENIEEARATCVEVVTNELVRQSISVYSPIAFWHHLAKKYRLPGDYKFWEIQDDAFIQNAVTMWVLDLPGWEESRGVNHELCRAFDLRMPTYLLKVKFTENEFYSA